jgi:hypothetical protein
MIDEDFGLPDNIIKHLIALEDEELPPFSAIKCEYIMSAGGLMVRSRREGLEVCVPVATTESDIPGLALVEPYATLDYPRVPAALLAEMVERSRRACRGERDEDFFESLFHLNYDASQGGWVLHEPPQIRRHSAVKPKEDGADSSYGSALIEIHVHPEVVPHFSEQDDDEESGKFRIFGIIGNLFGDVRRLRIRVGVHDHFCEVPAAWLFELPEGVLDCTEEEGAPVASAGGFEIVVCGGESDAA